mgnify:CR=1 FL=1
MQAIILFLIFIFQFQFIYGWGKTGHRICGEIAEKSLSDKSKKEIIKILGHHNLSSISCWADEIKADSIWDFSRDWHYCTVPDNESYQEGKYKGSAVMKIEEQKKILIDSFSSETQKIIAIKFLVHIVQDIHQPLHVGNGADRGGNDIQVKWFNQETNLHKVWDYHLIDHEQLSFTEFSKYLLLNSNKEIFLDWSNASINDIVHESKVLRKECYKFENNNISWEYIYDNKALLEQRLLQSGIRLAGILNRLFH